MLPDARDRLAQSGFWTARQQHWDVNNEQKFRCVVASRPPALCRCSLIAEKLPGSHVVTSCIVQRRINVDDGPGIAVIQVHIVRMG